MNNKLSIQKNLPVGVLRSAIKSSNSFKSYFQKYVQYLKSLFQKNNKNIFFFMIFGFSKTKINIESEKNDFFCNKIIEMFHSQQKKKPVVLFSIWQQQNLVINHSKVNPKDKK